MEKGLLINQKISLNNFDVIRFLLASSVIYCHSFVIFYGYEVFKSKEPFMVLSQGQISIGSAAVNFFFVTSGFLVVKSFESSSNSIEYLIKRILRIYPGFIIAFLVSILLFGYFGFQSHYNFSGYLQYIKSLHKKEEIVHLLTLQSPNENYYFKNLPQVGLNNSLWTIQYEFICYLIIPLVSFIGFFKWKWMFVIAFLATYIVLFLQIKGFILPFNQQQSLFFNNIYHYPRFIVYFLSGACFYVFRNNIIRNKWLAILSLFAVAFSFIWIKCVDQVLPIAGTYLLFYIAFYPGLQFYSFSKKGDYSYGLYLYAWPVQQLTLFLFLNYLNPFRIFFLVYPIVIFCAFLSWHLIEKHFIRMKRKNIIRELFPKRFSISGLKTE